MPRQVARIVDAAAATVQRRSIPRVRQRTGRSTGAGRGSQVTAAYRRYGRRIPQPLRRPGARSVGGRSLPGCKVAGAVHRGVSALTPATSRLESFYRPHSWNVNCRTPESHAGVMNKELSPSCGGRVTFLLHGQEKSNPKRRPPRLALAGPAARQVRETWPGFSTVHPCTGEKASASCRCPLRALPSAPHRRTGAPGKAEPEQRARRAGSQRWLSPAKDVERDAPESPLPADDRHVQLDCTSGRLE
jgi:hypothetical protein